jgi:hypothetical protein
MSALLWSGWKFGDRGFTLDREKRQVLEMDMSRYRECRDVHVARSAVDDRGPARLKVEVEFRCCVRLSIGFGAKAEAE